MAERNNVLIKRAIFFSPNLLLYDSGSPHFNQHEISLKCLIIVEGDQEAPCSGEGANVGSHDFDHDEPSSQTTISLVQTEIGAQEEQGENYDKLSRQLNFINGIEHHDKRTSLWTPHQTSEVSVCFYFRPKADGEVPYR